MPPVKPVTDEELLGEVAVELGSSLKHHDVTQSKIKVDNSDGANVSIYIEAKFTPVNEADIVQDMTMDEEDEASSEEKLMKTDKKRGAGEVAAAPNKKRSPVKAKVDVKVEKVVNAKKDAAKDEATKNKAAKDDIVEKTTPKKAAAKVATPKKATPAKGKAMKFEKNGNNGEDDDDGGEEIASTDKVDKADAPSTPSGARKRTPAKPGTIAPARGIPTSWEEATEADKMLVTMKDNGTDWPTIRAAWKAETGQDTGSSTLPNRYARLKAALQRLTDGDEAHLLTAKEQVEAKFESEKYALIAEAMENLGTQKYPTLFVQKKVKELMSAKPKAKGLEDVGAGQMGEAMEE